MSHLLEVRDVHGGYHKTEIVHGVSFTVERGEFVCIIGANGCGKTTTLKTVLGLMKPTAGEVLIDGKSTHDMDEPELARHFAYIPQAHTPPFPFNVADVVLMGRTPYVSIEHLANRPYTALSGGQQQLVLIARALTQEPDLLVMDEPTASLDFGNQQLVLSRMKSLSQAGMGVVMVTHDPDHALFCADKVIVMEKGLVINEGTAGEVITNDTLRQIYGTNVHVIDVEIEPGHTERVCIPL